MPIKNEFEFDIDQKVQITCSGVVGYVNGRAEYKNTENQFHVKCTVAPGTRAAGWFYASDLTPAPAK